MLFIDEFGKFGYNVSMTLTTLCYIEQNNCFLMLYRNRKKVDENAGKWIGVGGKFLEGESPEDCLLREVKEETGLTLLSYRFRGIVTFVSDEWGTEQMFLYTADRFEGTLTECDEGELKWIPIPDIPDLSLWEGDRIFLKKLTESDEVFFLKLTYSGDKLVSVS